MHFSQISLRDWKAFSNATFTFSNPSNQKNINLIGAKNGFGKTSIFEAIILGLYGIDGLKLTGRSSFDLGDNAKGDQKSYNKFMEKAIHRGAVEGGRNCCSVKLIFDDGKENPIEIRRVWHFSDTGVFQPNDEQIQIFEGMTRKPVGPMKSEDIGRHEWYKDYISSNLLPLDLVRFFMFDGEFVSVLAEMDMSMQVRRGIEGLLGIPELNKLATNLRDYANIRRKTNLKVSNTTIEKLQSELDSLNNELEIKSKELEKIEPELVQLNTNRDKLARELATFGSGSQALLQEKFESMKEIEKEIDKSETELEEWLLKDIALSLSGRNLHEIVMEKMEAENARENWESARNQGDDNLNVFIEYFGHCIVEVEPKLTELQKEGVIEKINIAWDKLWYPPPPNCAEKIEHRYLKNTDRTNVKKKLLELDSLGTTEIANLLDKIYSDRNKLKRIQEEINRTESTAPKVEQKQKELMKLNGRIQELNRKYGELDREISGIKGQIKSKNADLTQMTGYAEQAKPAARRATNALKVASLIDEIVENAIPSQVGAIAKKMEVAHKSMSHKTNLIKNIEISDECDVRLMSSKNNDIRAVDLSAGEKQIFTQSLLSAVSDVSQRSFPLVIDTPLGRLDVEHRKGLLNHLTNRDNQVILLSTNTEVVGEYLNEIEKNVQMKYKLQFEQIGEFGQTRVEGGYFLESEDEN